MVKRCMVHSIPIRPKKILDISGNYDFINIYIFNNKTRILKNNILFYLGRHNFLGLKTIFCF